ncbi:MAG: nuclear transport factor 2 family protein [Saprospiraceae bacterium]|nr:nuclear transport factor 2 family protein [Saprospiraceae bacterium]
MKTSTLLLSCLFALTLNALSAQSARVQTVIDNYARFGAGDIPGILATLDPAVVWTHAGDPALIPFAGTHNGVAGAGQFFEIVGKSVQVRVFLPSNYRETGNTVVADVHIEGIVVATGKSYTDEVQMNWTFGPDGKVVRWEATGTMAGITAASK